MKLFVLQTDTLLVCFSLSLSTLYAKSKYFFSSFSSDCKFVKRNGGLVLYWLTNDHIYVVLSFGNIRSPGMFGYPVGSLH